MADLDRDHPYGPWKGIPIGEAMTGWKAVRQERRDDERHSHEAPWLKRPGFARAARDAAESVAPLEAAYRAVADVERQRLAPQLAEAEERAASHEAQDLAHLRFLRIDHPEVPRRLGWIEREMASLGDELFDTRMDPENAIGQDWEHADPSWADRGWGPSREMGERQTVEYDFGPDLGL